MLTHTYAPRLVALSVVIATLASYVGLELAGRITSARGPSRTRWLLGGAGSMGVGVWAMHYIGMLAFSLDVPVVYDLPTVLLSLVAAVLASGVALSVVSRSGMTWQSASVGSVAMGGGIGAMHYLGMGAMRMDAMIHWNWAVVALSIAMAIVISAIALGLAFHFRSEARELSPLKLLAALVMGTAIAGLHYTGMAAATFMSSAVMGNTDHAVTITALGTLGISMVTFIVLALAIVTSMMQRRLVAQELLLHATEERHRAMFQRSLAGVYQTTPEGQWVDCNDALARILGFASREECLMAEATDFYADPVQRADFVARLRRERQRPDFENELRRRDGTRIWVLENATLLGGTHGEPELIEGTMIDITQRKLAEQALRESEQRLRLEIAERQRMEVQRRLKQKLESVGQLAAGIAHEINTPVQYVGDSMHFLRAAFSDVRGLLEGYRSRTRQAAGSDDVAAIAREMAAEEETADLEYLDTNVPMAFDRVFEGTARVASIVRAIKDFGRPDAREMSAGDINRAIETTLVVSRNEWKYVAEVETVFGDLPMVHCHIGDLNQVFLNLVVNAAHAIQNSEGGKDGSLGRIRIATEVSGSDVVISVRDSGCGIPEAIRERVFDPFFTTKEVGHGTGQGLMISRNIVVEKHAGSLTFETETGTGTTFYVRLPINGTMARDQAA